MTPVVVMKVACLHFVRFLCVNLFVKKTEITPLMTSFTLLLRIRPRILSSHKILEKYNEREVLYIKGCS